MLECHIKGFVEGILIINFEQKVLILDQIPLKGF